MRAPAWEEPAGRGGKRWPFSKSSKSIDLTFIFKYQTLRFWSNGLCCVGSLCIPMPVIWLTRSGERDGTLPQQGSKVTLTLWSRFDLSIYLSIYPNWIQTRTITFFTLSIHPSIYMDIYLSIYLSIRGGMVHRCHGSVRTSVRGSRFDTISVQQGKKIYYARYLFIYFEQTVVQITIFFHLDVKILNIITLCYIYKICSKYIYIKGINSWNIFDLVYR